MASRVLGGIFSRGWASKMEIPGTFWTAGGQEIIPVKGVIDMMNAVQAEFPTGRRDFLWAGLAGLILSLSPSGAEAADMTQKKLLEQDLPALNMEGWEFQGSEITFPPGFSPPAHRHSGFVIGYVLQGDFRFQLEGRPVIVLKPGQMFYEPPGVHHLVAESASDQRPARILVILFGEKGKPMTVTV